MSKRNIVKLDNDGRVVYASETATDLKGLRERVQGLDAALGEQVIDAQAKFSAIVCDGCDRRVTLDLTDLKLPDGWTEQPIGDFCPACSQQIEGIANLTPGTEPETKDR